MTRIHDGRVLFILPDYGGASWVVVVGFVGERLHPLPCNLLAGGAHADDLLSIEVGDLYHHAVGNNLIAVRLAALQTDLVELGFF